MGAFNRYLPMELAHQHIWFELMLAFKILNMMPSSSKRLFVSSVILSMRVHVTRVPRALVQKAIKNGFSFGEIFPIRAYSFHPIIDKWHYQFN